jgi:hypothetical protein
MSFAKSSWKDDLPIPSIDRFTGHVSFNAADVTFPEWSCLQPFFFPEACCPTVSVLATESLLVNSGLKC